MSTDDISVSIPDLFQISLTSGQLNSAIVFTFLSGMWLIKCPRYVLYLPCNCKGYTQQCIWGQCTFTVSLSMQYLRTNKTHSDFNTVYKIEAKARNRIALSAFSLLYAICMVQLAIQWYYVNLIFVTNGETRLSIFETELNRGSIEVFVVFETTFCLMFIIADALLVSHINDIS